MKIKKTRKLVIQFDRGNRLSSQSNELFVYLSDDSLEITERGSTRPVTLIESVKWMAKQHRNTTGPGFSMEAAMIHWFELIAKELAGKTLGNGVAT